MSQSDTRQVIDGPAPQHGPALNSAPAVQAFGCATCGELFPQAPSVLPVWDDCDDECCITACLICRDRAGPAR